MQKSAKGGQLNRRCHLEIASRQKINSSRNAFEILHPLLGDCNYEEFYVLFINYANFMIGYKRVSDGGMIATIVDNRKIFKLALEHHATSIIIAHNHPSGNINPSEADKIITKSIKEAGKVLDIELRDHIIVQIKNSLWSS